MPNKVSEAHAHLGWRSAMIEEMDGLTDNGTWDLVRLFAGKKAIGFRWVFTMKVNPDGSIARLKPTLLLKGMPNCEVDFCRSPIFSTQGF